MEELLAAGVRLRERDGRASGLVLLIDEAQNLGTRGLEDLAAWIAERRASRSSVWAAAAGLPAFAALYWKKATTAGILSGMIAGFTVCIGWKLAGLPFGLGATVPGAIACAAALVIVSLATYKKSLSPFLDPYAAKT